MKNQKINTESLNELFNNEDFVNMWVKMHTPYLKKFEKVGRNEICPFCNSGKKFKNCECYEQYKNAGYTNKVEKEKQFYQQLAADYENGGLENML